MHLHLLCPVQLYTSAPSEELFAGLVVNKLRNRLDPENVDDIVFLHDNWEFIENLRRTVMHQPWFRCFGVRREV